ncbi:hypothetical protein [Desulfobacula toluolica]|uniref:hypothetical protein n=1 Tax=Desulfobacula toluolica TaxID=28223 RepID=UPI000A03364D|nr:hypothetical protein [Desulfobacula toluolica]
MPFASIWLGLGLALTSIKEDAGSPLRRVPCPAHNRRVNRTARVSFFLKVEKLLNDVLPINFIGNPCCPLPKRSATAVLELIHFSI